MQNKNGIRMWIVLAVVLAVYNVLAFAIPFQKNAVFVMSYLFSMIAILAQIYVIRTAFLKGKDVKSKFYGFPIAKLGVFYLAAQLILGFVFMALSFLVPVWLPLILYVILLGAAAVGMIAAEAARDKVTQLETQLVKDTSRMRRMQAKSRELADGSSTPETKKVLTQLAEEFRYSDPVSDDTLTEIEVKLEDCLERLSQAAARQNTAQVLALVQETGKALAERNRLCKMGKK